MSIENVIVTERLTRVFGAARVVHDVNLNVPPGVVYGFLGPNGAGKTTTIRMILGLIKPSAGRVLLFGHEFNARHWQSLARVGTLVESPSLYPHLTGRENLEVIRRMLGLPAANIARALDVVGLGKEGDKLVRHYSLGMQQRLALALAMLDDPLLLVLDEPTNGLDPSGIQEIREMIRDMPRRTGTTVFLSSHLLSEVELMATHVGIINKGNLLYQGELAALKAQWGNVLRIVVDRVDETVALLAASGRPVKRNDAMLEISSADDALAFEVNRLLMQHGIQVRQLYIHQAGLEEMFLTMTTSSSQEER
jgi:ABC-2 type transport system ATP-binding protein